ncbi:MAG: peptidoglycan DD-metalloendopeptidase family protein [Cyanobacteriota bacterium]|nr:peptidoglycan DD-metalloendopeptidase family protein [Cyanobacteriota bacterium]
MGTARQENQLEPIDGKDGKAIAPQRRHRPATSRNLLLKAGYCLASLSLLGKGMAVAEEVLEIEVYDYDYDYEPAPADYYQPPPESAYVEPYWEPEPYYYQEPETYYSQPAPSTYYYQEPEPYYSQPAPEPYWEPEPYYYQEPEPYYSQPAPEPYWEPEPYYSQPAPEPYWEPEPYYSQPAPEPYWEPEPYYSQPAPSYQEPIGEIPKLPALEKLEEPSFLPDDLYVAPPTTLNLNKRAKAGSTYYGNSGNAYIDRNDYNVGATDSYESPSTVVFSERSSGCEAVLETGQGIVGSVCDYAEPAYVAGDNWSAPTANNWSAPTANNWSEPSYNNNNWSAPTQTAATSDYSPSYSSSSSYSDNNYYSGSSSSYSDDSYYSGSSSSYNDNSYYSGSNYNDNSYYSGSNYNDNSYYSGSNYGSGYYYEPEEVQVASVLPAQLGGLFEVNPMSNSGLAYYNRTMRPPSVRGNGDKKLLFPLSLPAPITSLFGWRTHPILGYKKFHTGTDLGAYMGTPVVAAYAGRVTIADWLGGYGVTVAIEHQHKSSETLYGHLSEIFVKPGEFVQQGEVIGRVGNTGRSTGPHLHFELREWTKDGWVTRSPNSQIEAGMASLMAALKIKEVPPAPEITLEELNEQTKDLAGKPQLPPLPPGFEVPIPDLVPPVFELTKASEESEDNSQLTRKVEEEKE